MTERPPTFDELLGGSDLDPSEETRLRRIHDLLIASGPPPELPPRMLDVPRVPEATIIPFVRRYRFAALGLAAALALALFGAGYGVGRGVDTQSAEFTVPMTGDRGAWASLAVFPADDAGNWPMKLRVVGLPALDSGKRYELWLTRKGALVAQCGSFTVTGRESEVPLNAPYRLRTFDGWVVVVAGSQEPVLKTETV